MSLGLKPLLAKSELKSVSLFKDSVSLISVLFRSNSEKNETAGGFVSDEKLTRRFKTVFSGIMDLSTMSITKLLTAASEKCLELWSTNFISLPGMCCRSKL
jgi:hypothetical protein